LNCGASERTGQARDFRDALPQNELRRGSLGLVRYQPVERVDRGKGIEIARLANPKLLVGRLRL